MSQAGNIKGPLGSIGGFVPSPRGDRPGGGGGVEREEKTRVGRSPQESGGGKPGAAGGEEKTRVGRSPLESGGGKPGGSPREPESKPGGTKAPAPSPFTQDGLETRPSTRAPERPREGARPTEMFEMPTAPRPSGERPRPRAGGAFDTQAPETPRRTETRQEVADISFESEAPQTPTSSPTPRRAEGGTSAPADTGFEAPASETSAPAEGPLEAREDTRDNGFVPRSEAKPEARPTRPEDAPSSPETGFETPAPRTEQPEGVERPEGAETAPDTGFETPERPETGRPTRPGEAKADVPFDAPLHPSSAKNPPQLPGQPKPPVPPGPPGTVAQPPPPPPQALDPEPKPLRDLLPEFTDSIGQESLAHHFEEELSFLGQQLRPSRLPPGERALRLWAFFVAYAQANAKDPSGQSPAGRARFEEALLKNGFGALRDKSTGKNGVETALALLDTGSPRELGERLAQVNIEPGVEQLPSEVFLPVAQEEFAAPPDLPTPPKKAAPESPVARQAATEPPVDPDETTQPQEVAKESTKDAAKDATKAAKTPEPKAAAREAEAAAPRFDQKEREAAGLQALAQPQGAPNPALVPPRVPVAARDMSKEDKTQQGPELRGTNKRLGSNMLWNSLHGLRDSPEDSAVLKEQWNQLAFGSIIALVGAALLIAMLASL